ncbi:MAG TPA: SIMPL domain-containing protein [Patescibacteria group bacterium]
MKINLDLRFLCVVLLIAFLVALWGWKPWSASTQTITVSGEATISAAPDEFVFSPTYQKRAAAVTDAISQVSELGNGVVAKLKEMGVAEEKIKTSVTSQQYYEPTTGKVTNEFAANYAVTATVNDKEVAKKILEYVATTPTLYGVSPQSTFTKETRKKLESEARGKGLADARAKAKQTAKELGVKLGRVATVTEGSGFGGPIIYGYDAYATKPAATSQSTTPPVLQTGTEDINFTVSVVYKIR